MKGRESTPEQWEKQARRTANAPKNKDFIKIGAQNNKNLGVLLQVFLRQVFADHFFPSGGGIPLFLFCPVGTVVKTQGMEFFSAHSANSINLCNELKFTLRDKMASCVIKIQFWQRHLFLRMISSFPSFISQHFLLPFFPHLFPWPYLSLPKVAFLIVRANILLIITWSFVFVLEIYCHLD